ncbi:MAG: FHA domain-containing protein [Thermoplasmatota archaeon]
MALETPDSAPNDDGEREIDAPAMERLALDLDALASPRRLALLRLLSQPTHAEAVARGLGITRQSSLKHLTKLMDAGFVRAEPSYRPGGSVIEYSAVPSRVYALCVALGDVARIDPPRLMAQSMDLTRGSSAAMPRMPRPKGLPFEHSVALLLVASGPNSGQATTVGRGQRLLIGRDLGAHLHLANDPFVSSSHAEIEWVAHESRLLVRDLQSSNGTWLNFARLAPGSAAPLRWGDVVGVGHTAVVVQPAGEKEHSGGAQPRG